MVFLTKYLIFIYSKNSFDLCQWYETVVIQTQATHEYEYLLCFCKKQQQTNKHLHITHNISLSERHVCSQQYKPFCNICLFMFEGMKALQSRGVLYINTTAFQTPISAQKETLTPFNRNLHFYFRVARKGTHRAAVSILQEIAFFRSKHTAPYCKENDLSSVSSWLGISMKSKRSEYRAETWKEWHLLKLGLYQHTNTALQNWLWKQNKNETKQDLQVWETCLYVQTYDGLPLNSATSLLIDLLYKSEGYLCRETAGKTKLYRWLATAY